jgi:hypothetical protein
VDVSKWYELGKSYKQFSKIPRCMRIQIYKKNTSTFNTFMEEIPKYDLYYNPHFPFTSEKVKIL